MTNATTLPQFVEDHDGDTWSREPGTADSYRLTVDGPLNEVRTLEELRVSFGPIYPAGTAL